MVYGGVAKTYATWEFLGEPFKDKYEYIMVRNPKTGVEKKVRWYRDQAHTELLQAAGNSVKPIFKGKCFGFEDENDYILAIRERYISQAELEQIFHFNWKKGRNWKFGMFFGGIWYAPKDESIPPIVRADMVERISWPQFVKAGRAHTQKIYEGRTNGFWFEQEVS